MLSASKLRQALAAIPSVPFEGTLHRAVHLHWLMNLPPNVVPQPLYSLAAPTTGARFTPVGGPPMLYFAEDAETAYAEANQVGSLVKSVLEVAAAPPTVLVAASVKLGSVLDLTDSSIQAALSLSLAEIAAPWRLASARAAGSRSKRPTTQRLGQAIFDSGRFQALRYESTRLPGHPCLAIFTGRVAAPNFIEVHDPHHNISQRIP